jgi:tetratricopeptide (TPR) repeat protein
MNVTARARQRFERAYVCYEKTEEYEQALIECEAALELDPYLADAHNLHGILLEELHRPLEALQAYRQAIRLDPDLSEARDNLSALRAEFASRGRLVTIARFSHATEAYIPKTRLEAEGLWAFVADAETVTMNWLYSNAIGGVKLQVCEADVERALEILNRQPEPVAEDDRHVSEGEEEDEGGSRAFNSRPTRPEKYAMLFLLLSWVLVSLPLPFLKHRGGTQDVARG